MRHERNWTSLSQPEVSMPDVQPAIRHVRLAGTPERSYFLYVPAAVRSDCPVVVSVHGISGNAAEHIFRLLPLARAAGCVLVAPVFSRPLFGKYQLLEDPVSGARSDVALIDILQDVATRCGVATQRVFLTGYSGGAQFAHRFATFHTERVIACAPCSAGWYSFSNPELAYPLGLAAGSGPGGLSPAIGWLKVPVHVFVGALDRVRDDSLNRNAAIDAIQGKTRVMRATRWVRDLRGQRCDVEGSGAVTFTKLAGIGHDYGQSVLQAGLATKILEAFGLLPNDEA